MTESMSSEAEARKLRTAGVFTRASATYDQVGPRFFAHYGRRLVEVSHVPKGSKVLDIACGRGASLIPAAEQIGPTGSAVGIDLAEGMIDQLASHIRGQGHTNVDVRVMDAEHLTFPDSTFDYVFCGFCLFFFPNLQHALSQFMRVLKPGGRLASSTWGKAHQQWQWLNSLVDSYLPDPAPPGAPPPPDFETAPGMQALLQEAGFEHITTVAESRTFTYRSEEEWWTSQWSHGMRAALERIEANLGQAALATFKAAAFDGLRDSRTPHGIDHPLPVLYTLASKPKKLLHDRKFSGTA